MTPPRGGGGQSPRVNCAMIVASPGGLCMVTLCAVPIAWACLIALVGPKNTTALSAESSEAFEPSMLLAKSLAWSIGIACASALVGWMPGRALRRGGTTLRALVVGASLIPAYAIFFCWWRTLRPGNVIADYAIAHDLTGSLRGGVLAIALVAWSWPIVAWICALRHAASDESTEALLELDGASMSERLRAWWKCDQSALGLGAMVVIIVLFGETVAFDAAQVATTAAEIRALDAAGASARSVFRAALPALAIAVAASVIVSRFLARAVHEWSEVSASEQEGLHRRASDRLGTTWALALVVLLTLLPIVLLAVEVNRSSMALAPLHARGALNTLSMAMVAGLICSSVALAGAALSLGGGRRTIVVLLALALVPLAAPATTVALLTAQFWRSLPGGGGVYDSWLIVSIAESARFCAVAFVIGLWAGSTLAKPQREIWVVHGRTTSDFITMGWPVMIRAVLGGWLVTTLLAASETAIAARLEPPGMDWIASSLLNAIHYQDSSGVSAAIPWMAALSVVTVVVCAMLMWLVTPGRSSPRTRGARGLWLGLALVLTLIGCDHESELRAFDESNQSTPPLPTDQLIGRPGRTEGRFEVPRAFAIEPSTGALFVVDKSGRVQRFGHDGSFEVGWRMPRVDNGKPTGMSFGPDGLLYVADTHEHRILVFDRDGLIVKSLGSYGQGRGEFVYPTDVAFAPDGRMFVSEYGGNDRIQVFDTAGQCIDEFGQPGDGNGEFARPQSIELSADGRELFVCDSCNHRIQVFAVDGTFLRAIGRAGRNAGEVAYPYGLSLVGDGSLLIAEFGNCRVQRVDAITGESLTIAGGGGRSVGRLSAPWSVALHDHRVYVLDCANGRVQVMPLEHLIAIGQTVDALR